jgi:5'-nucleotidase
MKNLLKFNLLLIIILFFGGISLGQKITILHTNDMHSKLVGYGPESEYSPSITGNDKTLGGFARLATIFKQAKTNSPNGTLIFDGGDFLMGSLFHVGEEETGFQLNMMKEIGYDYITLGNHEFDFGPKTLADILNAAQKKGGYPQIISSNLVFSNESADDNGIEEIYKQNLIRPYIVIEKNGLKIGIFGLVGLNAASVAPAAKPVTFSDPVKVASKMANFLKNEQKVDIVICLSHSGFYPTSDKKSYVGEDLIMAEKVPMIDIIISGHTHVATPIFIKQGNTYIVQTGSFAANVGEINFEFKEGKIQDFNFKLIPVDDKIQGDDNISSKIEEYKEFLNQKYLIPAGLTYNQIVAKTNFDLICDFENLKNSNLGPFLADASMFYMKKIGSPVDFSLVTSGTIREDILMGNNGILTVADIFRVESLGKGYDGVPGYPLAKIYITANEVKKLMEVLVMSRAGGGDGFLFFSGIKVYVDPSKGMLRKVQKVEINGKGIDYSKENPQLFSLTANTYLLSFIGEIKKMSHGLVKIVPKDKDGNPVTDMKKQIIDINPDKTGIQEAKEWIGVIEFMKSFGSLTKLPVIPDNYKKGDEAVVEITK